MSITNEKFNLNIILLKIGEVEKICSFRESRYYVIMVGE